MLDWSELLARGTVVCRIRHNDDLIRTFTPTQPDQLRELIAIPDLGEAVWVDFSSAFVEFAASGEMFMQYACVACKTIEKFGAAIQFKEPFCVEFERLSST